MEGSVQKPDQIIKPPISESVVPGLVERLYGLKVISQRQMVSYDDRNFHIKAASVEDASESKDFTLKITNNLDSTNPDLLESIVEIQKIINAANGRVKVPMPVINLEGGYIVRLKAADLTEDGDLIERCGDNTYALHMLSYLPGTTMYHVPYTSTVLNQYGQLLAELSFVIQEVTKTNVAHVLRKRRSLWCLYNVPLLLPFLESLKLKGFETEKATLIETCVSTFRERILENDLFKKLPEILIHGDYNEHNVIVDNSEKDSYNVYGVLDFVDCHFAPRLFEISIAIAYAMLESKLLDPLVAAGHVLAGYQTRIREFEDTSPLDDEEIDLIKVCVQGRLAQSLTMGAYTSLQDPSNAYVLSSAARGWTLLKTLVETDNEDLKMKWNHIMAVYDGDSFLCYETAETQF